MRPSGKYQNHIDRARELDIAGRPQKALAAFKQAHIVGQLDGPARKFVAGLAASLGDDDFARQVQPEGPRRISVLWMAIGVAFLLIIGITAINAPRFYCDAPVLSAFCAPEPFLVQVRVTTQSTGAAVANAGVSLAVGGQAPFRTVTDSAGVALFEVDGRFDSQPGTLTVIASGYQIHTSNITLRENTLPLSVQLKSMP